MSTQSKFIQGLPDEELTVLAKATKWYLWQDADSGGRHLKNGEYGVCERLAQELGREAESRELLVEA